jgi:hypothetical protein
MYIVLTLYLPNFLVWLQCACTWAPFSLFTGMKKNDHVEFTQEMIDIIFDAEWAPGFKIVTVQFLAYIEHILWRTPCHAAYVRNDQCVKA